MLINLIFGLFYLSIINDFELGYSVARNLTGFQYYDSGSQLIYLAPGGSNILGSWGTTYLPFVKDPNLDYCMNSSVIPPRSNSPDAGPYGLTTVTIYDIPKYTVPVAIAPYVDSQCANAFADQASADKAKVLIFVNDQNVNASTLLNAPSGSGALGYSMISTSIATGSNILYAMVKFRTNETTSISLDPALNSTIPRIGVEFLNQNGNGLSKLWIAILSVLAGILVFFITISLTLNLIQLRRRRNLRQRIVRGEVNLEVMGVSRMTVPTYILNSLPIRTYKYGEMHFLTEDERRNLNTAKTVTSTDVLTARSENSNDKNFVAAASTNDDTKSSFESVDEPKSRKNVLQTINSISEDDDVSKVAKSAPFGRVLSSDNLSAVLDYSTTLSDEETAGRKVGPETKVVGTCGGSGSNTNLDEQNGNTPTTSHASNAAPHTKPTKSLLIDNNEDEDETNSLSAKKIPKKKRYGFHRVNSDDEQNEEHIYNQISCPICLEDFVDGETDIRELPCRHIYHMECIDPFLRTRSSLCPLCKVSVLPPGYIPRDLKLTSATIRRERIMARRAGRTRDLEHGQANDTEQQQRQQASRGFWSRNFLRRDQQDNGYVDEQNNNTNDSSESHGQSMSMQTFNRIRRPSRAVTQPPRNDSTNRPSGRRLRANLNDIPSSNPVEDVTISPFQMLFRRLFPHS
ncbi:uncharacterized protein SAPINGB_P001798 [Magnusiomyces paraingens]|uniref:RING-type domain-containing protein n=1 Tax=Magnusiomyces paraingens TaxID=2606893 RepID=A0A5E8BBI6_9ASCO|nr:uncharacterized protein SAPINGB_P001798 [Saprochaete ingens]VVT48476.1 unnamed protein product [Saprochaete ingens]